MLRAIRRFQRFLHLKRYDHAALFQRIRAYLPPIQTADASVTAAIHGYLQSLLWLEGGFANDEPTRLFYAAYCLAALSLHAFFGPQMGNGAMGRLHLDPSFQLLQIYQVHLHRARGTAFPPPVPLTNPRSALCDPVLPPGEFLGREEELADLVSRVIRGSRTLVSGIGGIGKTELLRQALRSLQDMGVFSRVACVDYAGSLQESFEGAFAGLHGGSPETRLKECVEKLQPAPQERTLLLIDHLDRDPDGDEGLAMLKTLRCDVVVTSRLSGLPGFDTLRLDGVGAPAARALFSRHYELPVQGEDGALLDALLRDTLRHHPLLCGLMGAMARAKRLSVPELAEWLDTRGIQGAFVGGAGRVDVSSLLVRLFRPEQLPPEQQALLRAFALLPPRTYAFDNCCLLLRDAVPEPGRLVDALEALSHAGWLYSHSAGYGMHPLIAEVCRGEGVDPDACPGLLRLLGGSLPPYAAPLPAQYVDIAAHAARSVRLTTPGAVWFLLNTVQQLANAPRFSSAKRLLSRAREALADGSPGAPELLFDLYAVQAAMLLLTEQVEGSQGTVRELARLLPHAAKARYAFTGLKWGMILAGINAMGEELKAMGEALEALPRGGVNRALYCDAMSHLQIWVYADYHAGIRWAKEGAALLGELGLSASVLALQLYNALAFNAATLGLFEEAMEGITRAERLLRDLYGDDESHAILVIRSTKGLALYFHGDYREAAALQREVLDKLRGLIREDSLELANSLVNLGNSLYRLEDHDAAIACFREAIAMHRRLSPADNLDRSTYLVSLGCALRDRGDGDEARAALLQAAAIAENVAGEDSVCSAQPHYHLGLLYQRQGEPALAADHLRRSLPGFERAFGAEHPRTRDIRERLQALA